MSANVSKLAPRQRAIPLDQIVGHDPITTTADFPGSTQIRALNDASLAQRYAALMAEDAVFPPIIVVQQDASSYLLADGHHRVEARWTVHNLDPDKFPAVIEATVHQGGMQDAIRLGIEANRAHGKQLTSGDYQHAFNRAVAVDLLKPIDVDATRDLLGCSQRTAEELTEAARDAYLEERNALIVELDEQGLTQAAIAKQVGLKDKSSVSRILKLKQVAFPQSAEKQPSPIPEQDVTPEPPPPPSTRDADAWRKRIAEFRKEAAQRLKRTETPEVPEGVWPLPELPPRRFTRPASVPDAHLLLLDALEPLDQLPAATSVVVKDPEIAAAINERLARSIEWLSEFNRLHGGKDNG